MKKLMGVMLFMLLSIGCGDDGVVNVYHSGDGVAFVFEGDALTVTLAQGDVLYENDPRVLPRVAFYVNGQRIIDDLIDQPEKTYTIETAGLVEIVKLSEGHMSSFTIRSIETGGRLKPASGKDLFIEFIGDSITAGYGVNAGRDDFFTTATQDVTKTYAYKAAKALNADLRIQAVSGSGVVSGSTIGGKQPHHVMPLYYEWEYKYTRKPDILVINLGTNDASYTRRDSLKEAEFTEAYVAFLKRLRALHPDAYIICALGIMGDDLYPAMEKAVEQFGDKKTATLRFDNQDPADGYGAGWHPSAATHEKAAAVLVERIREIIEE